MPAGTIEKITNQPDTQTRVSRLTSNFGKVKEHGACSRPIERATLFRLWSALPVYSCHVAVPSSHQFYPRFDQPRLAKLEVHLKSGMFVSDVAKDLWKSTHMQVSHDHNRCGETHVLSLEQYRCAIIVSNLIGEAVAPPRRRSSGWNLGIKAHPWIS